jgi:hypothetical protein
MISDRSVGERLSTPDIPFSKGELTDRTSQFPQCTQHVLEYSHTNILSYVEKDITCGPLGHTTFAKTGIYGCEGSLGEARAS